MQLSNTSSQIFLFSIASGLDLVELDEELESFNKQKLSEYLQDKIRASRPSSVLSKQTRGKLSISSQNIMDAFSAASCLIQSVLKRHNASLVSREHQFLV